MLDGQIMVSIAYQLPQYDSWLVTLNKAEDAKFRVAGCTVEATEFSGLMQVHLVGQRIVAQLIQSRASCLPHLAVGRWSLVALLPLLGPDATW